MDLTFAEEYSAIHKGLLNYLELSTQASLLIILIQNK